LNFDRDRINASNRYAYDPTPKKYRAFEVRKGDNPEERQRSKIGIKNSSNKITSYVTN
jgi:hypothetical protein